MAVSGAAAMVFEIAWTRALSLVIGSSTYAFTSVLVVALVGIAGGSAVYAWRWGARPAGLAALGAIEAGVGGSAALAPFGSPRPPALLGASGRGARHLVPAAVSLAAAGGVGLAPPWDARVMSSGPAIYATSYLASGPGRSLRQIMAEEAVLYYRDGRSGTVAVTRRGPPPLLR